VLRLLEEEGQRASPDDLVADLPLFAARPPASKPQAFTPRDDPPFAVIEALAKLNPDELTPRQALDSLYSLKSLLAKTR
jgi:DNA mismatch repair protein MutS